MAREEVVIQFSLEDAPPPRRGHPAAGLRPHAIGARVGGLIIGFASCHLINDLIVTIALSLAMAISLLKGRGPHATLLARPPPQQSKLRCHRVWGFTHSCQDECFARQLRPG